MLRQSRKDRLRGLASGLANRPRRGPLFLCFLAVSRSLSFPLLSITKAEQVQEKQHVSEQSGSRPRSSTGFPALHQAEGEMEVTVAADGGVAAPSAEEADAEGFLQSSSARDSSDALERKLSGSSAKTPAKAPGENEDENMTGAALSSFIALLRDAREEVYREVGYGSLLETQTGTTTSTSNGKQLLPCTIVLVVVSSVLLLLLFAVLVVYCIFTKNGGPKSRGSRAADAEERSPLLKAKNKRSASSRGSGREEGQGSTGSGTFSGDGRTQTPIATGCPPVEAAPSK